MLKSAAALVMLVAAPAFAQEGGARIDFAALKALATAAAKLVDRQPGAVTLSVAQVNICDDFAQAVRTERVRQAQRLKVAPR